MPPLRVLVVDDEPSHLITLSANLELEGMDIVCAGSAEEALGEIRQRQFDLVLSDVKMPGMNGVELFRRIRRLHPTLPVILMTGFAVETLIEEALREGAFAVLPKPFDLRQVLPLLMRAGLHPTALIVDSSPEAATEMARALKQIGVRAQAVSDEKRAIETLRDTEVDVCVIDLLMASSGVPPLVERMTQINPQLGFIAISGHAVPELIRKVSAGSLFTWLPRPVPLPLLARTIATTRGGKVARR